MLNPPDNMTQECEGSTNVSMRNMENESHRRPEDASDNELVRNERYRGQDPELTQHKCSPDFFNPFRASVQDSGCDTHVLIGFQSENEYAGP